MDSLPIEVHGHRCFHPLCASIGEIGETGYITGLWLRGGEVHTAAMADEMADEIAVEAVELGERHIAPVRAVRLDAATSIGQPARCLRGTGVALSGAPSKEP